MKDYPNHQGENYNITVVAGRQIIDWGLGFGWSEIRVDGTVVNPETKAVQGYVDEDGRFHGPPLPPPFGS